MQYGRANQHTVLFCLFHGDPLNDNNLVFIFLIGQLVEEWSRYEPRSRTERTCKHAEYTRTGDVRNNVQ